MSSIDVGDFAKPLSAAIQQKIAVNSSVNLGISVGTSFPTSPADGDLFIYKADAANGVDWLFVYDSSQTTYKWVFIGGPPLLSEVVTQEGMTSTTYVALATAGPTVVVPRAGDYDVTISMNGANVTNAGQGVFMSYDIGGVAAVDTDAIQIAAADAGTARLLGQFTRTRRKTGLSASTSLMAKYRSDNAASATTGKRVLIVTPVRVI